MTAYWRYLWYVLRHKGFVFLECCRLGVPWLGIVHDSSKFLPDEFIPYARFFYKPTDIGAADFDFAWLLHQKRNKHHWQWWVLPYDDGGHKVMEIPLCYRREMLADWRGAGRAQGTPDTRLWYTTNKGKMMLGLETRAWVEKVLP